MPLVDKLEYLAKSGISLGLMIERVPFVSSKINELFPIVEFTNSNSVNHYFSLFHSISKFFYFLWMDVKFTGCNEYQ